MSAYDFALVFARPRPRQSPVPSPHLLDHSFTFPLVHLLAFPLACSFISPLAHLTSPCYYRSHC
jgi:hypothetical protein